METKHFNCDNILPCVMFENIVVLFKEPIPELRPFIAATRLLY